MFSYFVKAPQSIGAIAPSSPFLAEAMADHVSPNAHILEIGAGTGALTRALIQKGLTPQQLKLCEFDPLMCQKLAAQFLNYQIYQEDARLMHQHFAQNTFDGVVSGLPLRNFSMEWRHGLVEGLQQIVKPSGYLIQFTYGFASPLPWLKGERTRYVLLNLPPAFVWRYRLG